MVCEHIGGARSEDQASKLTSNHVALPRLGYLIGSQATDMVVACISPHVPNNYFTCGISITHISQVIALAKQMTLWYLCHTEPRHERNDRTCSAKSELTPLNMLHLQP